MNLDHSILSIITFVPLVGAIVLALVPDKGKTMQWGALAVTLLTVPDHAASPVALRLRGERLPV